MQDNSSKSNEAQIRFWNTGPGANWVKYQDKLDKCFENVNRRLLEIARLDGKASVLDVGCGGGATILTMSEMYGPKLAITGLDVSEPLLTLAADRIAARNISGIQLLNHDVQESPLDGIQAEAIVSRFGVMFFTDPVTAFANLGESLTSGGAMLFMAWSDLTDNPWFSIPREAAIRRLGQPEPVDPREPGPMAFADLDYLQGIVQEAGYMTDILRAEDNVIETDMTAGQMAELACQLGPAVRILREKGGDETDRAAIKDSVESEFARYGHSRGFRIPPSGR